MVESATTAHAMRKSVTTPSGMTSDSAMSRNDTAATATLFSTFHTALMVTDAITVATKVKPMIVCFRNPAPGDINRRAYSTQPLVCFMASGERNRSDTDDLHFLLWHPSSAP